MMKGSKKNAINAVERAECATLHKYGYINSHNVYGNRCHVTRFSSRHFSRRLFKQNRQFAKLLSANFWLRANWCRRIFFDDNERLTTDSVAVIALQRLYFLNVKFAVTFQCISFCESIRLAWGGAVSYLPRMFCCQAWHKHAFLSASP